MIEEMEKVSPLRAAQITMTEMLLAVDQICREEEIPYWITDGTLLGSERHKGFIPWDDDADIGMLRKDYNRFRKIVGEKLPQKFKVETETIHTHGKHNWLKILFLDDYEWVDWHGINRKGISIDVFPYDYASAKNQKSLVEKLVHRVASIEYPPNTLGLKNKIRKVINKTKLQDIYSKLKKPSDYITYGIETAYYGFAYYRVDDIFPLKEGIFEGIRFKIPQHPNHYLTTLYGDDYMKLPEESKRVSHMAELTFSKK
ncbi:LicD family protein [Neobacillus sp. 19]|uniref:LicD family protein n=1 Tax=Neobacillus sp. 19 TaxID=3394458 RepID=UPI003BF633C1